MGNSWKNSEGISLLWKRECGTIGRASGGSEQTRLGIERGQFALPPALFLIERVPQSIPDKIERQHRNGQHHPRQNRQQRHRVFTGR